MKILHISTSDSGGAGLAAIRLHKSLLNAGYDSKMLVANKTTDLDTVFVAEENLHNYIYSKNKWIRAIEKRIVKLRGYASKIDYYFKILNRIPEDKRQPFTFPITHYDISENRIVKAADVIHLHWISSFVDYETFFRSIDKPIIWTFHDENIGFGGFHHSSAMFDGYHYYKKVEDKFWKIKNKALRAKKNITMVALSDTMKSFYLSHAIGDKFPVKIIYNSIDSEVFTPQNKDLVRQELGIPKEHYVIVFCSHYINDKRKGGAELIKAIELIDNKNITLLCVGEGEIEIKTSFNIMYSGYIESETRLAYLFSSGNLFVLPSYQESFGQAPLEAMACGVPVVGFPVGIIPEIMNDSLGVICTDFSIESLASGIKKARKMTYNGSLIRESIISKFSPAKIATNYINMYSQVLNPSIT